MPTYRTYARGKAPRRPRRCECGHSETIHALPARRGQPMPCGIATCACADFREE